MGSPYTQSHAWPQIGRRVLPLFFLWVPCDSYLLSLHLHSWASVTLLRVDGGDMGQVMCSPISGELVSHIPIHVLGQQLVGPQARRQWHSGQADTRDVAVLQSRESEDV